MGRRTVAVVTAGVLLVEAVGAVAIHGVLALVVEGQNMSLDGLAPGTMVTATWGAGLALGVFLGACALVAFRTGVRDRAPGRFAHTLLVCAAVLHGVLGALAVGLVGWSAFVLLMAALALTVWVLVSYGRRGPQARTTADGAMPSSGVAPA
ncbi:hypothetical protein ABZ348_05335 [Streptomyces sp. NPDC005963]|uniref:hypothetical protein n=1 Tax=Streptomyces sp. NPDC005963 TaxID=3156721 RepID=UPI0034086320